MCPNFSHPLGDPASATVLGRYLIVARADPRPLQAFLDAPGPGITVVDTIGPPQLPHTAVAEMSAATARALEQRFRLTNQLSIEPDRPLSLSE